LPDAQQYCYGSADCFAGYVTKITDGDTIEVDGKSIRFALVNTPEYGQYGYEQARNYVDTICPVGSVVVVDEDDGQTQGSYGRIIARILCVGVPTSLNEAVVVAGLAEISTSFCSRSEFAIEAWAQNYGCAPDTSQYIPPPFKEPVTQKPSESETPTPPEEPTQPKEPSEPETPPQPEEPAPQEEPEETPEPEPEEPSCDPSYPDVCIPPYPPDLNCGDISHKNFRVVGSDPHRFDGDNDGIGCES
jgi:micrococcal nuclease